MIVKQLRSQVKKDNLERIQALKGDAKRNIKDCRSRNEILKSVATFGIFSKVNSAIYNYLYSKLDSFIESLGDLDGNKVKVDSGVLYLGTLHKHPELVSDTSGYKGRLLDTALFFLNRLYSNIEEYDEGGYITYINYKEFEKITGSKAIINSTIVLKFLEFGGFIKGKHARFLTFDEGEVVHSANNKSRRFTFDKVFYDLISTSNEEVIEYMDQSATDQLLTLEWDELLVVANNLLLTPTKEEYEAALEKVNEDITVRHHYQIVIDLYEGNAVSLLRISRDDYAGRLHHVLSSLKKSLREKLRFRGGEESVEVDVHACQPTLLMNYFKNEINGGRCKLLELLKGEDFYNYFGEVLEVTRKEMKVITLNFMYTNTSNKYYVNSVNQNVYYFGLLLKELDPDLFEFIESFKGYRLRHSSELPRMMQMYEVKIFNKIWSILHELGIEFTTIHDAIKCRKSDALRVKSIMEEVFGIYNVEFLKDIVIE